MMELYEKSSDLNFNFESFSNKNCTNNKKCDEKDGKCLIIFSDSYETGSELDMSYKQRNQANARERYRTHRYQFKVPLILRFVMTKND